MTQLGMAVAAMNHDSVFQAAYEKGIKKSEYWTYTLEDCINLLARLPTLAARIYRNVYNPGQELAPIDRDLDLVGACFYSLWSVYYNSCRLSMQAITRTCSATGIIPILPNICAYILLCMVIMRVEMLRLTQRVRHTKLCSDLLYAGNNCIDLVASTLSDPYLAYSAALFALAGPLHGFGLFNFFFVLNA